MIGLFLGRFQPLHNGHLEAIRKMQRECSEVIIIVGSSQYCFEANNPFTIGERIEMITASLKDAGLWGKCQVLSIPFHDRKNCDGTKIRALMLKGSGWEKFVPAKAAALIKRVKGPERMKEVGNGDKFEDRK